MRNGLHVDTRTSDEAYQEGRTQGIADFAAVAGEPDAVERRIKFCATMADQHQGSNLGSMFAGRLAGLRESAEAV